MEVSIVCGGKWGTACDDQTFFFNCLTLFVAIMAEWIFHCLTLDINHCQTAFTLLVMPAFPTGHSVASPCLCSTFFYTWH